MFFSGLPNWFLPSLVFFAWCMWVPAAVVERAVRDASLGIAQDKRGRVSVFPVLPLFPLLAWGAAVAVDRYLFPWGTVIVGAAHVVLAVTCSFSAFRNYRRLQSSVGSL